MIYVTLKLLLITIILIVVRITSPRIKLEAVSKFGWLELFILLFISLIIFLIAFFII